MRITFDSADLARRYGIQFMAALGQVATGLQFMDKELSFDAQPALVTVANAGVPSLFTTYVDPAIIEVLVSPVKAAQLYGETKKGTWIDDTAMFIVAERTGVVSSYGDFSNDGMSSANVNYPQRQSYHYQTNTKWGEREMERAAAGKVDWANQLNMASALTLIKYQNLTYLYGVAGLQNYGGTNDPSLSAAIAPTTNWFTTTSDVIYGDVLRLVQLMVQQGNGLVDSESKYNLGISPGNLTNFNKTNQYNVNVFTQLKTNFPGISIVSVPEFALNGGGNVGGGSELVQLIAPMVEGQKTVETAFTEKMRAHAIVTKTSSWEQKKSQGTWGTILYYPAFIAQMIGA